MRLRGKSYRAGCVAAAAVVLLAGCGGGGKAQTTPAYVRQVDAVANGLNSVTNYLATPTDASSAATELRAVQRALRKAASELAAITPPPAIRGDHARLVKAISELAAGVTPLIAKLKAGDIQSVDPARVLEGAARARAAIAAIVKAGYKIQIQLLG
jgi:hypothetical protein